MRRRAFLAILMSLVPAAALAQAKKRFMLRGLGNALLLETTGSSTNQAFFSVIELENCTPNPADNNCWILLETNTPGWTGHP